MGKIFAIIINFFVFPQNNNLSFYLSTLSLLILFLFSFCIHAEINETDFMSFLWYMHLP